MSQRGRTIHIVQSILRKYIKILDEEGGSYMKNKQKVLKLTHSTKLCIWEVSS